MRNLLAILFSFLVGASCFGQSGLPVLEKELLGVIKQKKQFVSQKHAKIRALQIHNGNLSPAGRYDLNKKLYSEYKKFRIDSAVYYITQNQKIALALKDEFKIGEAALQLANLYSSSGKYREAETLLKRIDRKRLNAGLLPLYYEVNAQFFEHYATNSYNEDYFKSINMYRDSLLAVLNPADIKYRVNHAQRDIYNGHSGKAEKDLLELLPKVQQNDADYAMITYLLGNIYQAGENPEKQQYYYTLSAIADIKNAIKDNAAIQVLALMRYEEGDIDTAYILTRSAIDDALFCGVKFRTLRISELYSIINSAYLEKEAKSKSQLERYLLLISILSLFLIIAVAYVYKQMRKVSRIKEELLDTTRELERLNADIVAANTRLNDSNSLLSEANRIKEEYIAHFFDLCSSYINKLEDYRKMLNRKATGRQLDELFSMLKSTTVTDNEVDELYRTFDTVFLNLYPTFVKDFNALLLPEEQVTLKQGELLNTELRIFALVRLGITDSVKIAAFLRYSLSTIYNYRTKARNKAAVSRDEFEILVSSIGGVAAKM